MAERKYTRISVDLTPDEYRRLRDHAAYQGSTHAGYVRRALDEKLRREAADKAISKLK